MGWASNNGAGICALPWTEIKSYADATESLSEPWEFRCVREMSAAYVTEKSNDERLRISPYEREK